VDFVTVVDQAIALLRQRGRLTYRTLQLQFQLDEAHLEALKDELIYGQRVAVDEEGRVLVWTRDEPLVVFPGVIHSAMMRLYADLVSALLQREGRLSYRTLTQLFGFDAACLDQVRQDLVFKQLARDVQGEGLEWTGGLPRVETDHRPAAPPDAVVETASAPSDVVPVLPAAPVLPAPEAERRQLTVLFCDLVGSTQLSGQLDPEDWRAVVRAYQEAAAEVIQQYGGHIAQYLGDGLLVYVGYPTAHEDDARRAVHTGLGMVQAIATLNTRLATQYGVQLAVRVGIHTGPVVVGVMGGGGRHEHLALGETPNLAARL
jgi:class 3 adenylate cyclase